LAKNKTILICPLDWGLGHATRMVPVIDLFLKQNVRVIIGADNRPLAYLQQRFPECEFIQFPGFEPFYPKSGSMAVAMLKAFPKMLAAAKSANRFLQELIFEKNIDVVISDNRYELHSEQAYTVFITHQLNIKTPGITKPGKPLIKKIINDYIKKYNELWIPDFENRPNLSGDLSHIDKLPLKNHHFIGPLSRFSLLKTPKLSKKTELLILLSGPEPQRTQLEEMLTKQVLATNYQTIILQGKPESTEEKTISNITIIPHLGDEKMAELILSADNIICRPGYSTIMDLAVLGKKAIFIPTPGQTEQEYLAARFKKEKIFYSETQKAFELKRTLGKQSDYKGLFNLPNRDCLHRQIEYLLKK